MSYEVNVDEWDLDFCKSQLKAIAGDKQNLANISERMLRMKAKMRHMTPKQCLKEQEQGLDDIEAEVRARIAFLEKED